MYPPTVCSTPYKEKARNCQGKLPPGPSPSQAKLSITSPLSLNSS